MRRRTKIMVICNDIDKQRDEYLEWFRIITRTFIRTKESIR